MDKIMAKKFLKWLALTSLFTIGIGVVEYYFEFFRSLASLDQTYLCYVIWAMTILGVSYTLVQIFRDELHLKRIDQIGQKCMLVGMLGSVLGLIYSFKGFLVDSNTIDPNDRDALWQFMMDVVMGIFTSLTTTATGIIGALILGCYILLLRRF